MRSHIVGLLVGLGLLASSTAPSLACAYHDQQAAAAAQQQTADATQSTTTTR